MKILLLDIETSPNQVFCWGIWEQNISINQMINSSKTLCYAAKWLGEKELKFDSIMKSSHKNMLRGIHKLLDEADVVVHYNGRKFDVPILNKEFLLHGFKPPSPYKQIDMLQVMRREFRFQSNKMDYVAQQLGIGQKVGHEGFQLWVDCMNNDPKAWRKMEKYNKGDVVLLEGIYNKALPWIRNHPNFGLHTNAEVCPHCGGKHYQRRGLAMADSRVYQRYQCMEQKCGKWFRGVKATDTKPKFKGLNAC